MGRISLTICGIACPFIFFFRLSIFFCVSFCIGLYETVFKSCPRASFILYFFLALFFVITFGYLGSDGVFILDYYLGCPFITLGRLDHWIGRSRKDHEASFFNKKGKVFFGVGGHPG